MIKTIMNKKRGSKGEWERAVEKYKEQKSLKDQRTYETEYRAAAKARTEEASSRGGTI